MPFHLLGQNMKSSLIVFDTTFLLKIVLLGSSPWPWLPRQPCAGSLRILMACNFVFSKVFLVYPHHLDFKLFLPVVLNKVNMHTIGDWYLVNEPCIENTYSLQHPVLTWEKKIPYAVNTFCKSLSSIFLTMQMICDGK